MGEAAAEACGGVTAAGGVPRGSVGAAADNCSESNDESEVEDDAEAAAEESNRDQDMATLARLNKETERLKEQKARKVFVSTSPVQAFRVTDQRKELISKDDPLILAISDDGLTVGPNLRWTLSGINHILRTVSKWGEPTYLFADILDNDPKAFVAVTLSKGTSPDELSHLESILSRVSQFHIAEKKPAQLPDPDQGDPGSGEIHFTVNFKRFENSAAFSSGNCEGGLTDRPWAATSHAAVGLQGDERAGRGPQAGRQGTAMGVRSKAEAEDRLAQLKAELAKEPYRHDADEYPYGDHSYSSSGRAPPASGSRAYVDAPAGPDTQARNRSDTSNSRQHYYPTIPGAYSSASPAPAEQHTAVTSRGRQQQLSAPDAAGGIGYGYQKQQQQQGAGFLGYEGAGGGYDRSAAYDTAGPTAGGGTKLASVKPAWGPSGAADAATDNALEQEAEAARNEWSRAQREADERVARLAAQRDRDGGWGRGDDVAGGEATKHSQQAARKDRLGQQSQGPDWMDLLGKVFGGPAYSYAAPDL
eukprot:gene6373-6605_t